MIVKDLVKNLSRLDQEATIVYSSDDEGNSFSEVYYDPSEGYLNSDGEFYTDKELKKEKISKKGMKKVVCIN